MMNFILICGLISVWGNHNYVEIRGHSALMGTQRLQREHQRVYTDGGQLQVTIGKDRKHIWVNMDVDDRPGRGDRYDCRK